MSELVVDDNAVVSIHYSLSNGHGDVVDSSQGQLPLVYMHNSNALLPALERELTGKAQGDNFEVVIYPEDGYGYANEELIRQLPREQFSHIKDLEVGMRVRAMNKESDKAEMLTIADVREDSVIVDLNHPLAGQVLHFVIAVVAVRDPTEQELQNGFASETNVKLGPEG